MAGLTWGHAFRPVLVLALIASGFGLSTRSLAEGASGNDGAPTPYPLPSRAKEAYSPIGEGFESPID